MSSISGGSVAVKVPKRKLSGSTDGKGIKVSATATAGTLLHTAIAGTTVGVLDEVWLFATNNHTAAVTLTIEFGGAAVENQITMTLAAKSGLQMIVPGLPLQNGAVVRAFASVADVIGITGFVDAYSD